MPSLVTETPEEPKAMIVNGADITSLTDDEIFRMLKELGAEVGPIIASTRSVYERKLFRMMNGEPTMVSNDTSMNDLRFSESENEEKPTTRRRGTTPATPPRPEPPQDESILYETPIHAVAQVSTPFGSGSPELLESSYVASARRPLRSGSARSSDSDSFTSPYSRFRERNLNGVQYSPANFVNGGTAEVPVKKNSSTFSKCFEIIFLAFLIIVGYVFYQEIQTYSGAEQEYVDSDAQNLPGDI